MKKKLGLAGILVAVLLFAVGCGAAKEKDIDAKALADSLATEVTYEDELEKLGDDLVSIYFDMEEGVTSNVYMGSGSTAEEVAVFEAKDVETATAQKAHVQAYLDDQAESFRDYLPAEVKRIEDAVMEQHGKYIVLCVSADSAKAKEIIEKAFQ